MSSQILFWSQLELCSRVWEKIYFPLSWPTSMGCPIFDWQLLNIFDFHFFQHFLGFTFIAFSNICFITYFPWIPSFRFFLFINFSGFFIHFCDLLCLFKSFRLHCTLPWMYSLPPFDAPFIPDDLIFWDLFNHSCNSQLLLQRF